MSIRAEMLELAEECQRLARDHSPGEVLVGWGEVVDALRRLKDEDQADLVLVAYRQQAFIQRANLSPAEPRPVPERDDEDLRARQRYEDARSALLSLCARHQVSPLLANAEADAMAPYTPQLLRGAYYGLLMACGIALLWALIHVAALLLILAALLVWGFWRWHVVVHLRQRLRLLREGDGVMAMIHERHKHMGGIYQFTLSYHWQGMDFCTPGAVSVGTFRALAEGDTVPIRVDPAQPNVWMLAATDEGH